MTSLLNLEALRLVLLYAHLISCAFAITYVLHADLTIARARFSRHWLEMTARAISRWLLALWITGLSIIWLDTGFDPALLAGKSKLLLKLVCVVVLTLNGLTLHLLSFPALMRDGAVGYGTAALLAITGSLSTSHWLLAAFIGIAKPLAQMAFESLVRLYTGFLGLAILLGLAAIPLVRHHVTTWRINQAIDVLPASPADNTDEVPSRPGTKARSHAAMSLSPDAR